MRRGFDTFQFTFQFRESPKFTECAHLHWLTELFSELAGYGQDIPQIQRDKRPKDKPQPKVEWIWQVRTGSSGFHSYQSENTNKTKQKQQKSHMPLHR